MRPFFFVLFLVIACLLSTGSSAQTADCHLQLGMNLAGPTDYNAEWPFVNIMKYGRTWETTNTGWTGGGQNLWNTELLEYFSFDEQGYPLQVPLSIDHPNADTEQIIRSLWANTPALPTGTYVLLYDGEGVIDFAFDATIISQEPGRIEVAVDHQDGLMALLIRESTLGNHVRNIRFLLPGTEATYATSPWTPSFLDKVAPFGTLRFMDWGYTNGSTLIEWSDRPLPTDYTYTQKGNPYEWWIDLCNETGADAWVCVPHLASDDYITQLALLFRDQLDPELNVYVEYSNELWNWIFPQAHYGNEELDQSLPWPERLGPRIADVMAIWTEVFGEDEDRLIRVLGTQHGWLDIGTRIYAQIEAEGRDHLIDAISPAAYLSIDSEQLANLGSTATGSDVVNGARSYSFDEANYVMEGWRGHAALAAEKGKRLLFYEGGQHFTPDPWGTVQDYNLALLEAQAIPDMHGLYLELLDTLNQLSEEEMLFMHFSFIAPLGDEPEDARWGSFGAITDQFALSPPYSMENAPKYRALLDWQEACSLTAAEENQSLSRKVQLSPNPARDQVWLSGLEDLSSPAELEVFTLDGKRIATQLVSGNTWLMIQDWPSGPYYLRFRHAQSVWQMRLVKL